MGTTLAQIAARAGVSPGLVAHYFGDKDGLLDAAFRSLARRVGNQVRARLRQVMHAARPHSGDHRCESRAGGIRPAHRHARGSRSGARFCKSSRLKRVQSVYQRRTLSNLRSSLKQLVPPDEAQSLAAMIAAMIDGVWLRAALSGWREADSESARALADGFVDGRLNQARPRREARCGAARPAESARPVRRFASINPATGEVLGYVTAAGSAQVNAAVRAARARNLRGER